MGIVLGLAALVMPLQTDRMITLRDGVIMLLATLLLIGVTLDSQISRVDGVVLLVAGAAAIAIFLRTGRADQDVEAPFHWWEIPRAVAALVLVLVSSHFFIGAAEHLSLRFGISPWLIGITIAAIGTSLPELVTSMAAAVQGQSGIILGNVLGSSTMNIVWVLGSAGVIRPMESPQFTPVAAVLLAALMVLAFVFIATGRIVARWEGAVLLIAGLGWYFAQGL
jgi:cation:H+ antiporter